MVKLKKCSTALTHRFIFLGTVFYTNQMSIALPEKHFDSMSEGSRHRVNVTGGADKLTGPYESCSLHWVGWTPI